MNDVDEEDREGLIDRFWKWQSCERHDLVKVVARLLAIVQLPELVELVGEIEARERKALDESMFNEAERKLNAEWRHEHE